MSRIKGIFRKRAALISIYIFLGAILVTMIVPYLWMILTSFRVSTSEVWSLSVRNIFPRHFTLQVYKNLVQIGSLPLTLLIRNSFITSFGSTLLNVAACVLAAYVLAIKKPRGGMLIMLFFISTMIIPVEVISVPLYLTLRNLNLLNSYGGMILGLSAEALSVIILYRFFKEIPREVVEAARIDGATELRLITRIILPLSWPAFMTVILLQFLSSWNAFIIPLVVAIDPTMQTLQLGMSMFSTHLFIDFRSIMALGTIITLPSILIFIFTQRKVIEGITTGGIK